MAMDHFHARAKRWRPAPVRATAEPRRPPEHQPLPRAAVEAAALSEERLDSRLVALGLAPSRTAAQRLIAAGVVTVDGAPCYKPAQRVAATAQVALTAHDTLRYVSRAGEKLAAALDALGWRVDGLTVLDVGQSTGGFTDLLVQRGAQRVVGVEVGHDQLAAALRAQALIVRAPARPSPDAVARARIVTFEGINARSLTREQLGDAYPESGFDLIVGDLSFISVRQVWPAVLPLAAATARLIWLIKPQFELGAAALGKNGVVREIARHEAALRNAIETTLAELGWASVLWLPSPIRGAGVGNQAGNQEFLVAAVRHGTAPTPT